MTKPEDMGRYYWGIAVQRAISPSGFLGVFADKIDVSPAGDLICYDKEGDISLAIAAGKWEQFWSAGVFDGRPLAVDNFGDSPMRERKTHKSARHPERDKMTQGLRLAVMARDGYKCVKCGRDNGDGVKLEVDHVVPVKLGGKTEMVNLQTLCFDCNRGKGASVEDDGEDDDEGTTE